MAEFVIKLADERGRVQEQVHTAATADELRARFAHAGYHVFSVRARSGFGGLSRRKVKLEPFLIFNQQFLTLIRAGLPIVQALELLAKRQRNQYFRSLLEDVRDRTKGGELISVAFEKQGAFPKIYSTTLMAGEKSGNLDEVLSRYVSFQRLALTFRKKLISSLVYPVILVVGVIALISMLVTFVIPKFAQLFSDMDQKLPAMTQFTITVALTIKHFLPFFVAGLSVLYLLMRKWARTSGGAETLDRVKLNMPIVGSIWQRYQIALFSRMLSTLLSGGLPLVTGLETAGQSMSSRLIVNGITGATKRVREGQPLSQSLEETGVFPDLAVEMVEVGEATGALPAMLNSVAEFYEEDVQSALAAAMALIEPAILVVMGVVVGFILISLYLPIFSFTAG
jgi:type IV pilus assembly protein PilC